MAITFTGNGIDVYTAIALKAGLRMYHVHRIKPNRDWTPSAMMRRAEQITNQKFAARDYAAAIKALELWLDEAAPAARATGAIS